MWDGVVDNVSDVYRHVGRLLSPLPVDATLDRMTVGEFHACWAAMFTSVRGHVMYAGLIRVL